MSPTFESAAPPIALRVWKPATCQVWKPALRGDWVTGNRRRIGISGVDATVGVNGVVAALGRPFLRGGGPFYGTRVKPGYYQGGKGVKNAFLSIANAYAPHVSRLGGRAEKAGIIKPATAGRRDRVAGKGSARTDAGDNIYRDAFRGWVGLGSVRGRRMRFCGSELRDVRLVPREYPAFRALRQGIRGAAPSQRGETRRWREMGKIRCVWQAWKDYLILLTAHPGFS